MTADFRRELRRRRNALSSKDRARVAHLIAVRLIRSGLLQSKRCNRVAAYLPIDGEADVRPAIRFALAMRCSVYIPRVTNRHTGTMKFVEMPPGRSIRGFVDGATEYGKSSRSACNFSRRIRPRELDLVLVPLVAFDMRGWRAGFGAGFYDRAFAFMRRQRVPKPLLIGIAYDFQRVAPRIPRPWDVLLHGVVTERRFYRFRRFIP